MSEANERLCEFLYLPQTWCAWDVRVYSPANFKLDQPARRGSLGLGWGIKGDKGPGHPRGPASVGCLRDERVSAGCSQQASRWTRGPVGWVRGPGSRQGYRGDRGAVPVLRGSMNMRVLVNVDSVVCVPALVTSCLCQPKTSRGCGWLFVFYASPACRCLLTAARHLWQSV